MSDNVVFVTETETITVHPPTGFITAPSPSTIQSASRSGTLGTLTTILSLPTISTPPTSITSSSSPDDTSSIHTPGLRALIFATFVLIVLVYILGSIALILLWFRKECPQCHTLQSQVLKVFRKPHDEELGPEVKQDIRWKAAEREREQIEKEEETEAEREKNRASALEHLEGQRKSRTIAHSSSWFSMGFKQDVDGSKLDKGKGRAKVNSVISPDAASQDKLFTLTFRDDGFVPTPLGAPSRFSNTSSYYLPRAHDIEQRENDFSRTSYEEYQEANVRTNGGYWDLNGYYCFVVEPMEAGEQVPCDNLVNDAYGKYDANPFDDRIEIGELSKEDHVPTMEPLAPPLPKARLAKGKNAWAGVFDNAELG